MSSRVGIIHCLVNVLFIVWRILLTCSTVGTIKCWASLTNSPHWQDWRLLYSCHLHKSNCFPVKPQNHKDIFGPNYSSEILVSVWSREFVVVQSETWLCSSNWNWAASIQYCSVVCSWVWCGTGQYCMQYGMQIISMEPSRRQTNVQFSTSCRSSCCQRFFLISATYIP